MIIGLQVTNCGSKARSQELLNNSHVGTAAAKRFFFAWPIPHRPISTFTPVRATHLVHDDGAVDGQLEVCERGAHDPDDALHAVDLLAQEDDERLQQPVARPQFLPHLRKQNRVKKCFSIFETVESRDGAGVAQIVLKLKSHHHCSKNVLHELFPPDFPTDLVMDVICRQLAEQFVSHAAHDALARLSGPTGAVLWLDVDDRVQHILGQVALVTANSTRINTPHQ